LGAAVALFNAARDGQWLEPEGAIRPGNQERHRPGLARIAPIPSTIPPTPPRHRIVARGPTRWAAQLGAITRLHH
jgi:hypothetical protein